MFNKQKYLTSGVLNSIPIDVIITLFILIDKLKDKMEVDYLQVFEITSKENNNYEIIHKQEEPLYEEKFLYESPISDYNSSFPKLDKCKVLIIDDTGTEEGNITVLLAEEY